MSVASLCVAPWAGSAATSPSLRLASGALRRSRCSREIVHGLLRHEAAEGIDWVWEHRIDDFREFGL